MDKNLEKILEVVYEIGEIDKRDLKKKTGLTHKELNASLDDLYWKGLIEIKKGKVSAIDESEVWRTFLERNVDIQFLRSQVDARKVEVIMNKSGFPSSEGVASTDPNEVASQVLENIQQMGYHTDKEFKKVERRMEHLFNLYGKLREVIEINRERSKK